MCLRKTKIMAAATHMHEREDNRLVPFLSLLAGGSLLGLSTNLAKAAAEVGVSPLAFLCWSISGAALVLMVVSATRRDLPSVSARTLEYYAVSAFVGVAGSNLIFFSAIPHIGAGFVALIIALSPLLTYVGALVLAMERFQLVRATGVAAALGGAAVLAARQIAAPDADVFWIVVALVGPAFLAIGNLYRTLRWPEGVSADTLAPGMLVAASVMLLGAGFLPGFSLTVPLDRGMPIILITVQATTFAGQFLLLFLLQKTGGPVLLSLLGCVGAAVGVPVAVFLQGESAPEGLFLGGVLITTGIALLSFGRARHESPQIHDVDKNP